MKQKDENIQSGCFCWRLILLAFNFIPSWPGVFLFFCPFAVKCPIFVEQCIEVYQITAWCLDSYQVTL